MAASKPKFAMYWAAGCGGCEIAVLNIGDKILAVDEAFDVAFWPCAADFKVKDVEGYADGYIDLCLFNGAIRNSENEEMAHLLRRKSKVLVAFGSCAHEGCIPALANLTTAEAIFTRSTRTASRSTIRSTCATADDRGARRPAEHSDLLRTGQGARPGSAGRLHHARLPTGAAPDLGRARGDRHRRAAAGTGSGRLSALGMLLCARNARSERHEKSIQRFYRPQEIVPEPELCLLEQGLALHGLGHALRLRRVARRSAWAAAGCYGPLDGVEDQGARMLIGAGLGRRRRHAA